jgi:DNA-binding transcriptional LysR family regulator
VDDLLRFKRVVEAGSISKASRLLFVSQPALTRSIQLLEDRYGVDLLERHPTGVTPTAYGRILYRSACELERCFLDLEDRILREKASHERRSGRAAVHIGCSTIWNDFLLPEVMRTVESVDEYEIHVTNDMSEHLLADLLADNRYDFVLCRILEDEAYKPLASVPLFESRAAVFVNEHHSIFDTGFDKEKLQELKWVKLKSLPVLQETDLTAAGLSLIPEGFFPSAVAFEVEDLMAAIQLLRHDHAILLPLALASMLEEYRIKPLPFPRTLTNSYWLGMVYSPDHEQPLHVRELMNRIRLFFSDTGRTSAGASDR